MRRLVVFLRPFVFAVARARGETRLERVQDWTADLCSMVMRRWAGYAWSPPTRRWQENGPTWPIPSRRWRAMVAETRARAAAGWPAEWPPAK